MSMGASHEKTAGMRQPSSRAADIYHREQRDTLILLLCMAFMLASLSSFLSLLSFYPSGSTTACAFVVAATTIASQAARVFGLVVLGLHLKRFIVTQWELHVFWVVLAIGTVLSGFTVGIGTGQLVSPQTMTLPSVTLCFRKRFLPTSLASSILNFVLELYIIIRSLSLMKPPRPKLSIVQDARIVQAGSLLLFELLVVVPYATFTSLTAEFVTYSIGALGVLAAFNSSFCQTDSVPTPSGGSDSNSRSPSRTARAPEASNNEGHITDRVIPIGNYHPSAIGDENWDVEAQSSPLQGPRAIRMPFVPPVDGFHEQAIPISSPGPIDVSARNIVVGNTVLPVAPLEPGNRPRREKILSYSSPVWATFGTPRRYESGSAYARPQISIETARSPTSSTGHSPEQDNKVTSPTSTILGSDIIRDAHPNVGKDRMRVRRSAAAPRLSQASSIPSSSKRATHQSWASILSAYPPTAEDPVPPRPLLPLPKETVQPSSWRSSPSLKSKPGSKSSRSSKSQKSSSSMRSAKAAVTMPAEGIPSRSAWTGSSINSTRVSKGSSVNTRRERANLVRGPRPPPFSSRIRREGVVSIDVSDHLRRFSTPSD